MASSVGGYGVSPMGSHGVVYQSVCLSVGWSVGRNQSVSVSRKKEKNVFPVTGRLVMICKREESRRLYKYRKMPRQ